MSRKIVAIGGGENARLKADGTRYTYETAPFDKEIIRLTGKAKPNFLLIAHSQKPDAKINNSDIVVNHSFTPDTSSIGAYTESNTDFTINYRNVNFDFVRSYNSTENVWFYSTDSRVMPVNDYVINAILPDGSKMAFIKTDEGVYTNEITGYILTQNTNEYVIQIDDINYYYGTDGYISSVGDKYDNRINVNRSSSSVVISYADRNYTVHFNSNNYIENFTYPVNNSIYSTINYTYDSNNNLTGVVDQAGVTIGQYSYENNKLSKSMFTNISYNDDGRISRLAEDNGAFVDYTYSANLKTITSTSSTNDTVTQVYNDAMLLLSATDENDSTTEYTYDSYYRLATETTDDATVTYSYDSKGNLISEVSDDENAENSYYVYDNNNRLIRQQSGDSYAYYDYDAKGNNTIIATLKEDYDGDIPSVYNSNLTCFDTISYNYDNNGCVITVNDSKENEIVTYTYDVYGNTVQTATINSTNNDIISVVNCTYDAMGNALTTTSGDNTVSYIYDAAGRILLVNDNGDCTRTIYDNLGRVIQQIEPQDYDSPKDGLPDENTYADSNAGHTYVYAENGNLYSEKNRLNITTTYTYFDNTNIVETETFDRYKNVYDIDGNILFSYVDGAIDTNGNYIGALYAQYTYNSDGNPTEIEYGNGQKDIYTYDTNGNLQYQYHNSISIDNKYVEYTYRQADDSNIDTESELDVDENVNVEVNEDYELSTKTNYDSGLFYRFYNSGLVKVYKLSDTNTVIYSYNTTNDDDDETTTTSGTVNGVNYSIVSSENNFASTYSNNTLSLIKNDNNSVLKYNGNNLLSYELTDNNTDNTSTLSYTINNTTHNFVENYGTDGKITSVNNDGVEFAYGYDNNGQLITVSSVGLNYTASYEYNTRGNITSKTINGATSSFTYSNTDRPDQLTAYGTETLTYDNIGNVLTFGAKQFTWSNGRNLVGITENDDSYTYKYNKYGYRTSKTVNGTTTDYTVAEDGTIIAQKKGDEVIYFEYDNSGTPLGFVYNGTQYLYITNISNDVMGIADTSGNIIVTYTYDGWGNVNDTTDNSNINLANLNPLRYRGYYYDTETGYYYLQSRYYDAEIGRFINADLPQYAQLQKNEYAGTNLFAYCCNDPVNNVDYSGNLIVRYIFDTASLLYKNSLSAQMYTWGFIHLVPYKMYDFSKYSIGKLLIKRLKNSTAVQKEIKKLLNIMERRNKNTSSYKGLLTVYSDSYTGYNNKDLMYATGDIKNFYVSVSKIKRNNKTKYLVSIAIAGEAYDFDDWTDTKRNKFTKFINNDIGYKSQKKGSFTPYVWYIFFSYYW